MNSARCAPTFTVLFKLAVGEWLPFMSHVQHDGFLLVEAQWNLNQQYMCMRCVLRD